MQKNIELFNELVNELLAEENVNSVASNIPSEKLYETFDLALTEEACLAEDFKNNLKNIVQHTPKTASRLFFNQLFGGRSSKAYLGELLAVMLNNSMYPYKVAGVQIGIEKTILKEISKRVGFGNDADGTFAAGGSMTIFMAMLMARDAFNQNIVQEGVAQKMTLYTSKESHYSVPKNAAFMGVCKQQVRYIKTDAQGKMCVTDLEKQIETDLAKGFFPFYINATASTTVLGAFDPIEDISKIAKKYKLWLHVDGAFGGSVIFSKKYKYLLKGVENADSFSLNAHKMLGTPLSTSLIVVKQQKYLYNSFSNEANYLYQTNGDDLNPGKISLQCGRRNDAFKFWTLWKAIGTKGLEKIVDTHFELANIARQYIRNNKDYTLYSFDDSVTICFNYKNYDAKTICNQLYEKNKLMVGFGSFKDNEFYSFSVYQPRKHEKRYFEFFRNS